MTGPVARKLTALAAGAALVFLAGCTDDSNNPTDPSVPQPPTAGDSKHGPFFPECGGISDQTVGELTRTAGLVNTAKNSVGCQWLVNGGIIGPHFSFTWFRGSPIGRERKTQELSRTSVDDIEIDGHDGFIAISNDPTIGDTLCEVGIQFDDDFIEWSVSYAAPPFPNPCDVAKELTRQSIANSK